jgi:hypothetical protein
VGSSEGSEVSEVSEASDVLVEMESSSQWFSVASRGNFGQTRNSDSSSKKESSIGDEVLDVMTTVLERKVC